MAIPSAIIFISDTLNDNVRDHFVTHLFIDEAITGNEFDLRVDGYRDGYLDDVDGYGDGYAGFPSYPAYIKAKNQRILVERNLRDLTNRELADIVVFFTNGMISIEKNKFGPPIFQIQASQIHWGKLNIWEPPVA